MNLRNKYRFLRWFRIIHLICLKDLIFLRWIFLIDAVQTQVTESNYALFNCPWSVLERELSNDLRIVKAISLHWRTYAQHSEEHWVFRIENYLRITLDGSLDHVARSHYRCFMLFHSKYRPVKILQFHFIRCNNLGSHKGVIFPIKDPLR
jgi:hypothetical protein